MNRSFIYYQGDSSLIDIISVKDMSTIKESQKYLEKLIGKFKENPSLKTEWKIGMEIEKSVVEKNYQKFMIKATGD